ncbi:MAG TPA: hypothetical protein VEQ65_13880 [Opitutus sp.]|nr:hypothetical protein [Opitutus sp.]
MKTRLLSSLALLLSLCALAVPANAAESAPANPDSTREFALVVVEGLNRPGGAITFFDRIDIAFRRVAKERNWPVKIVAERFAANSKQHATELRVFEKTLQAETPLDRTIRAWMILTVDGVKHDFGIVTYRYYPRAGENGEDTIENVFLGVAREAAKKIEPILFPNT